MRIRHRSSRRRIVTLVLAATIGGNGAGALAASNTDGTCAALIGTFVTSVADREGVFSSRGLMTFTSDGIVLVSDSAQGGVAGLWDPFSGSQGSWKCRGADGQTLNAAAVALNFVLPRDGKSPRFARIDYELKLDSESQLLSGTATLRFTSGRDLEALDPIDKPGPALDTFQFDGRRLRVGD